MLVYNHILKDPKLVNWFQSKVKNKASSKGCTCIMFISSLYLSHFIMLNSGYIPIYFRTHAFSNCINSCLSRFLETLNTAFSFCNTALLIFAYKLLKTHLPAVTNTLIVSSLFHHMIWNTTNTSNKDIDR